ncbi:MAG: excinuclease ABC subunit UvrB [Armatimonadetes bacterium]|nr:excinuclease ABC subunit UvrB [Armatimonadota bacterium]
MPGFEVLSEYTPKGDQPAAISALTEGLRGGMKHQTLLGATGTGKTFTIAHLVAEVQRPTLVIAHNKTLAAQLCAEFREFLPNNRVEYFVSFYDYYQPEAYLPETDTYIEKDAQINDEIDRLRHSATQALMERRDTIVVASVSCIYGLGAPDQYEEITLEAKVGESVERDEMLRQLVRMQFTRNDYALDRGQFRVRGDVIEIHPVDEDLITRIELFGDEVERITVVDQLTGEILEEKQTTLVFAASHYVASRERQEAALKTIEAELEERLAELHRAERLLEAQRLEQRTKYDLEMIREVGYCQGIENYSRHFDGRRSGEPPYTLIDYFPADFLMVIDESHQTIPQLRAMLEGDRSRKRNLVEHGFRLPSAFDNRPLSFAEWEQRINQVIYVSATPGPYELAHSSQIAEQIIRPTGLIDPEIEVRPTENQVDDLVAEIRARTERHERVLVTTLTKRMAEDLAEYLAELGVRVHYLHSEVQTFDRTELLRDLRLGAYDVLVGINLLREGLDLPEVSLVAILDADREGFLRSTTSLVQITGRAARNVNGRVIMYADEITAAMREAIDETNRRRAVQSAHNEEHGIEPATIEKAVRDTIRSHEETQRRAVATVDLAAVGDLEPDDLGAVIASLEKEMRECAAALDFERAAALRDEISELNRLRAH